MNRRKLIPTFVVIFVLVIVAGWYFNHSYLLVEVEGNPSGNITYRILDQKNNNTIEITTAEHSVKKLVGRSNYEVTISQNNKTYFGVASTGPFLKTTNINGELTQERAREFVGNNPSPCMYDTGALLLSYTCKGSFEDINIHMPATISTPPTVRKPVHSETSIDGIARTPGGPVVLVSEAQQGDEGGLGHKVYPLLNTAELEGGVELKELSPQENYSIQSYEKGFIVYPDNFSTIFYYEKLGASPKKIEIESSKNKNLLPVSLSVSGKSIAITYSKNLDSSTDLHGDEKNLTNEVIVFENQSSKHFTIKGLFASMILCGTDKVCGLNGDVLKIYDISNNKPKLEATINQVGAVDKIGSVILIVKSNQVLSFDVDKQEGYVEYSLGDYKYCGVSASVDSYVLCLINNRSDKVALRVSKKKADNNSIDKKISGLLELSEITNVSVYGKYIFISPDLGKPVFNTSTGYFGFDVATKNKVNAKIQQEVDRLGIDRSTYSVINTFD